MRVPTKASIPPYPAKLKTCKRRARANLARCINDAGTSGQVSQCQTKHGKTVEACLAASRRAYERVRVANQ